jgi:short-subunit dehydrogenase
MSEQRSLGGKTIVITGASSGFGRGAAVELAKRGANVVVAARRGDVLDEVAASIAADGGSALAVVTDVSERPDVDRLAAATIERFGGFDVWVNNVGVGALGAFWEIPVEDQARVIDVNLKGLVYGAHVALRHFVGRQSGTLINVGSVDSEVPIAFQATYAATKAGVLSLSRSLNEELRLGGHAAIKVGTIMPWAVDTPWWTHAANYTGHAPRMASMDDPSIVVDAIVAACEDPKEEQPVGWKAHGANISHHLFPDLTERFSASVFQREVDKASRAPMTSGSIHEPMTEGTSVDGGIRERMRREDAAPV